MPIIWNCWENSKYWDSMASEGIADLDTCIDDEDYLFRAIPSDVWDFAKNRPGTFALNTEELSCDWAQKRSPDEFMAMENRTQQGQGCVRFKAQFPRKDCNLVVRYDPIQENDAHSLVLGKKPKPFLKAAKRENSPIEIVVHAVKVS